MAKNLLGYKGSTFVSAGYVYAPYVPLYTTSSILTPLSWSTSDVEPSNFTLGDRWILKAKVWDIAELIWDPDGAYPHWVASSEAAQDPLNTNIVFLATIELKMAGQNNIRSIITDGDTYRYITEDKDSPLTNEDQKIIQEAIRGWVVTREVEGQR